MDNTDITILTILVMGVVLFISVTLLIRAQRLRRECNWILNQRIVVTIDDKNRLVEIFGRYNRAQVDVIGLEELHILYGDEWRGYLLNELKLGPFVIALEDNSALRILDGNYTDWDSYRNNGRYHA